MSKDAYYFPHDCNAKDDPKCVLMIEQLGLEAYGIFWMLIETLRDQQDHVYPVANIPALARRYNTSAEKVRTVVYNYQLFTVKDDLIFFSESLNRRMQILETKRIKRSEAGRLGNAARWGTSQTDRNAITMRSQCIASKVNKSKVYKKDNTERKKVAFSPPTLSDVEEYVRNNGYTSVNPQTFINYYTSVGWMVGKNKMKDWRAAVRTWNSKNKTTSTQIENQPVYQV